LDSRPVAVLLDVLRGVEVDDDLARLAGVVRAYRAQVGERPSCTVLDHLAGLRPRQLPRAEPPETFLHRDSRKPVAEQPLALAARRLVAGHEQHRAPPGSAERGIDPG